MTLGGSSFVTAQMLPGSGLTSEVRSVRVGNPIEALGSWFAGCGLPKNGFSEAAQAQGKGTQNLKFHGLHDTCVRPRPPFTGFKNDPDASARRLQRPASLSRAVPSQSDTLITLTDYPARVLTSTNRGCVPLLRSLFRLRIHVAECQEMALTTAAFIGAVHAGKCKNLAPGLDRGLRLYFDLTLLVYPGMLTRKL